MPKYTCDIIICTKNRPEDLKKAIESILTQTVLPNFVIISDASDDQKTSHLIQELTKKHHLPLFKYIKSDISSSTHQRNIGIKASKSDIIFFFDDDVVLEKDYIKETLSAYQNNPAVSGISGHMINHPVYNKLLTLFRKLFLLPYYSINCCNTFQLSGFPRVSIITDYVSGSTFMEGGLCSYKKEVLDEYCFDETLQKYALFEDLDLSYRVSQKYKLIRTPAARLYHYPSPRNRIGIRAFRAKLAFNHFYLFKKNFPKDIKHVLAHLWSHLGLIIESIGASLIKRDINYLLGIIDGYKSIFLYVAQHKLPE